MQRDALVLRLGSETTVDVVVIEESAAEKTGQEASVPEKEGKPAIDSDEWAANRFLDAVNYYQRRIPAKAAPIQPKPIRVGLSERNCSGSTDPGHCVKFFLGNGRRQAFVELMRSPPVVAFHQEMTDILFSQRGAHAAYRRYTSSQAPSAEDITCLTLGDGQYDDESPKVR